MPILTCPNCSASMRELKRNSVALDMCPTCKGVWLDRGELENLVNNVLTQRAAQQAKRDAMRDDNDRQRRGRDDEDSALDILMDILR